MNRPIKKISITYIEEDGKEYQIDMEDLIIGEGNVELSTARDFPTLDFYLNRKSVLPPETLVSLDIHVDRRIREDGGPLYTITDIEEAEKFRKRQLMKCKNCGEEIDYLFDDPVVGWYHRRNDMMRCQGFDLREQSHTYAEPEKEKTDENPDNT